MTITGTVQGWAAQMFPDFLYRRAEPSGPVTMRSLDPDRMDPCHEYPRFTRIRPNPIRVLRLADYKIKTSKVGVLQSHAQVFMMPGLYTQAKEPLLVLEFRFSPELLLHGSLEDFALGRVFGSRITPAPQPCLPAVAGATGRLEGDDGESDGGR